MHFISIWKFSQKIHFLSKNTKIKNTKFNFFTKFSNRNTAMKLVKMHRFEPRSHDMKAPGLLFHMVKTRLKTGHFQSFCGQVPKSSFFQNPCSKWSFFWPKMLILKAWIASLAVMDAFFKTAVKFHSHYLKTGIWRALWNAPGYKPQTVGGLAPNAYA